MRLKCPLCLGVSFTCEETLLYNLVSFTTINIACPLCAEVHRGFDKFTIHLCSHILKCESNYVDLTTAVDANIVTINEQLENIRLNGPPTKSAANSEKADAAASATFFSPVSDYVAPPSECSATVAQNTVPSAEMADLGAASGPATTILYHSDGVCTAAADGDVPPETSEHESRIGNVATKGHRLLDGSSTSITAGCCPPLPANRAAEQKVAKSCELSTPHLEPPLNCDIFADESARSLVGHLSSKMSVFNENLNLDFSFLFDSPAGIAGPDVAGLRVNDEQNENGTSAPRNLEYNFNATETNESRVCGGGDVNTNLNAGLSTTSENISCDFCSVSLPNANILALHKELVHEKMFELRYPSTKFGCQLCKRKFKLKASLLVHEQVAHPIDKQKTTIFDDQNEENIQFRCKLCTKIFKKENYLVQHLKTHEEKQWTCDECGKIFATKHFLLNHKRLHTGEMPYICSICDKQFTFQQSYHRHIAYHNNEKPYSCKECSKSFKELSTLYNHQRIHTGEKPFACNVCGKRFRQRVTCLMHSRIHSDTRQYKCNKCHKAFRYKVSLKSHKCVHSNDFTEATISTNE